MNLKYIEELQESIRRSHGVEAKYVESVPVKETFQGKTVWEGVVEVFELVGHPKAPRIYAWAEETDSAMPPRHVTVLHIAPALSAEAAVKAAIVREFRDLAPEDES
jgi:hypothetical protein